METGGALEGEGEFSNQVNEESEIGHEKTGMSVQEGMRDRTFRGQQGFCTSEARMNRNQCFCSATLVQDTVVSPVDSCNNFFAILLPLGCFPSNPHSMFC